MSSESTPEEIERQAASGEYTAAISPLQQAAKDTKQQPVVF
ncbi:MAG: hypothetical protein ACI9JM_003379 [Halioglobus sp.]|jgi:hypothetical protein